MIRTVAIQGQSESICSVRCRSKGQFDLERQFSSDDEPHRIRALEDESRDCLKWPQKTRTVAFAGLIPGTKRTSWSMCFQSRLRTAGSDTRLQASCKAGHGSFLVQKL